MQTNPLLTGIRVLDLSRLLPGPFATLYLAQLGAEVIKIEEPDGGDYARGFPELFEQVNRGKKSVTLDLRKADELAQFKQLVIDADVVVDTFRPDVLPRLGCGYETLKKINPRLVFASLTGYGHSGPYRNRPGHDMNYRGYAGELAQNGPRNGTPQLGDYQVADLAGGLSCVIGILAAVIGARASGIGCFVDIAMLDCTMALQVATLSELRGCGSVPEMGTGTFSGAIPNYGVYPCADGGYLALGSLERKFFVNFCTLAGRKDLLELPHSAGTKSEALRLALEELIGQKTRDEWEALLADEDTCASAILNMKEAVRNPQIKARKLIDWSQGKPACGMPIQFDGAPRPTASPSPSLGQHNVEILKSMP